MTAPARTSRTLALLIAICVTATGCAQFLDQLGYSLAVGVGAVQPAHGLSWKDLSARADVSLGEPRWEGNILHLPMKVDFKAGEDLIVPLFEARKVGHDIYVSTKFHLANRCPETEEMTVVFKSKPAGAIRVMYEDPDRKLTSLGTITGPQ